NRITDTDHDDGDGRRRFLGRIRRRRAVGRNQVHRTANELGRDRREPVWCPLAIAVLIGEVLAFDVSELAQGLPEGLPHRRVIKDADARGLGRLLPPRALHLDREQQTAAADQSNELTPFYVEHGGLPPLCLLARRPARSVGLPHAQPAPERRLSPWGRPELF